MRRIAALNKPELPAALTGLLGSAALGMMMPGGWVGWHVWPAALPAGVPLSALCSLHCGVEGHQARATALRCARAERPINALL